MSITNKAKIVQLEAELAEVRLNNARYAFDVAIAREDTQQAEARLATVVKALREYGEHRTDCESAPLSNPNRILLACDCGLREALADLPAVEHVL